MRLVSIVGARPQFVKLAAVCHAILDYPGKVEHRIIHTGQHYDPGLSDVFFEELGIPPPDHHLGVGSGSHGEQTGAMLQRLEQPLRQNEPDWVILYGDTNSTLAGAVVASKMGLKTAHIEAGLRSFNRRMPEEINRVVADHLSNILLCPTDAAMKNLRREGLADRARRTGDVMLDAALLFRERAERLHGPLTAQWKPGEFALATIHRAENTDDIERLRSILRALERIATTICPVLLPLHPRTRAALERSGGCAPHLSIIPPASYLEMLLLEHRARFVLTDSGGVQKEAYFVETPCVTLRDETEWEETLINRCNVLVGADEELIVATARETANAGPWTAVYGDGHAGTAILETLREANAI